MPLGSAEIEQIGTYVRANLAEWMEDIVGPRLLGRTARVEDELTFQRELICTRFEAVDKRFEEMLHRFDTVDKRFEDMHEISLVCDALGIDPWELIGLANRHPGVGGHCIAVDPWFIVHSAPERTPLMQAARQVNSGKPRWVAEQVLAACQGTSSARRVQGAGEAKFCASGSTRQSNPQCRKASAPTSRERSSESSSDERRR